jgi:hypothetical protein
MPQKVLLITPPFTQLNTPYPATPALLGFLAARGYRAEQADLGIELINKIFSRESFTDLFGAVRTGTGGLSPNSVRILRNEHHYLRTVDLVMNFLRHRDDTAARVISTRQFLPRASRFDQLPDLDWSFGNMGQSDKARFLATLYIEDIGDLIREAVTPFLAARNFGALFFTPCPGTAAA